MEPAHALRTRLVGQRVGAGMQRAVANRTRLLFVQLRHDRLSDGDDASHHRLVLLDSLAEANLPPLNLVRCQNTQIVTHHLQENHATTPTIVIFNGYSSAISKITLISVTPLIRRR